MRRRPMILPLLAVFAVCAGSLSAADLRRGTFLQDIDRGFALWIPDGYTKAEPRSERAFAYFTSGVHAAYAIEVNQPLPEPLSDLLAARLRGAKEQFPGGNVDVIRDVDAGGGEAVLLVFTALDGNREFQGAEFVVALVALGEKSTLPVTFFTRTGGHGAATEVGRWVLATLRDPRQGAVDQCLGTRRIHRPTGLSYRPPRALTATATEGEHTVFSAADPVAAIRLHLSRVTVKTLEEALAQDTRSPGQTEHVWRLDHPRNYPVCGTFRSSGKLGSVRIAFRLEDRADLSFLLELTGSAEQRERMQRLAELIALEAQFVDTTAAAARADTAIAGLVRALKQHKSDQVAAHVQALCEVAYIDRAAICLADNLARLEPAELQIAVCAALASCDLPVISPALLKAAKNSKIRVNPPVLAKVLEALGYTRSKKVINFLLSHATRGDNRVSAAAIRALGNYVESRDRVVRRLVDLMARAESAAQRTDYAARERWDLLRPAFREALANLTGETFRTADEAEIWLRRNRF